MRRQTPGKRHQTIDSNHAKAQPLGQHIYTVFPNKNQYHRVRTPHAADAMSNVKHRVCPATAAKELVIDTKRRHPAIVPQRWKRNASAMEKNYLSDGKEMPQLMHNCHFDALASQSNITSSTETVFALSRNTTAIHNKRNTLLKTTACEPPKRQPLLHLTASSDRTENMLYPLTQQSLNEGSQSLSMTKTQLDAAACYIYNKVED